jgi:hypothetical protein
MAYTNVQFIAYVIDTAAQPNPNGSQTYLGLSNAQQDIAARCGLMRRAMETARDALPQPSTPQPPGTTLKVFMAPAFFFRGAAGAYQMDEVQRTVDALQGLVADARWQDWAFVLGSIVGVCVGGEPLANQEVYNFVPVQLGGVAVPGSAGAQVLMQAMASGVEYIAATANPGGLLLGNVNSLPPSTNSEPLGGPPTLNYDGAGVFELADMTWCLEVCQDPGDGVQRLQRSPQLPGANQVQLQLASSGGMGATQPNLVVQTGGYVFNCDGGRASKHCALMQLLPPLTEVALVASAPVSAAPLALPGASPPQDVPLGSLYASGAGLVNVYPPRAIPARQTVPGRTIALNWPVGADYGFNFQLVYGGSGDYVTMVCEIRSRRTNFHGNNYYMPLSLQAQDSSQHDVRIDMRLVAGSGPYAGALWCKINLPGSVFEGIAFEFSATVDGPPPFTIW